MITLVWFREAQSLDVALVAKDLQLQQTSPSSARSVWRILARIADLLTFVLVFALSAAAVVILAIAAPVAVSLSALSGLGGRDRRRGRWRAAPAA